MKKFIFLFLALFFISCKSRPVPVPAPEKIQDAQIETAVQTAVIETVTTSAVQDAEYILEAVKTTGDADLIYIAEKHVAEVKKIAVTASEQKETQAELKTETAEIINDNAEIKIDLVKTESKLQQVKKTRNELIFSVIAFILFVIVFLVIKFRAKLKKWLPFLPL